MRQVVVAQPAFAFTRLRSQFATVVCMFRNLSKTVQKELPEAKHTATLMNIGPQYLVSRGLLLSTITCSVAGRSSQRLQNPLIEESTLSHIRDPIIISDIFLNLGVLEALGSCPEDPKPWRHQETMTGMARQALLPSSS